MKKITIGTILTLVGAMAGLIGTAMSGYNEGAGKEDNSPWLIVVGVVLAVIGVFVDYRAKKKAGGQV